MNINLKDIYVVSYSYICEGDDEIVNGNYIVIGRENALKVAADTWENYKKYEFAHVMVQNATVIDEMIVNDVYSDPVFDRLKIHWDEEDEDGCSNDLWEGGCRDEFWDDESEYELED